MMRRRPSRGSYLAFRGAGARAVLAGAATRYPGGDYYLHNGIFTARRAPMPWLDVNDDALRDVVAAVRDGHAVLLEPSASNPWRNLFRSWCWMVIFRVTVPVCALATTYLAVQILRARGFGELLPVLVLVVEALSMLSIARASSIFGLYWSGDVAGRWVTELHISMYIGGGFFTSVLMSMHLASLRKHLQSTIEEEQDAHQRPRRLTRLTSPLCSQRRVAWRPPSYSCSLTSASRTR